MNWHCRSAALFVLASDWSCCVLSALRHTSFEAMGSNLGSLFPTQCLSYLPPHLLMRVVFAFSSRFFFLLHRSESLFGLSVKGTCENCGRAPEIWESSVLSLCNPVVTVYHPYGEASPSPGASCELLWGWSETDPFHRCSARECTCLSFVDLGEWWSYLAWRPTTCCWSTLDRDERFQV